MDTKKIKLIGFPKENEPGMKAGMESKHDARSVNQLMSILGERYRVELSEEPDYVIVSEAGLFPGMKYDGVRILYTGAHFAPDFNVFDYAVGPDCLTCLDDDGNDRYFRLPECELETLTDAEQRESGNLSAEFRGFLFHIFDQNKEQAYRRLNNYNAKSHQKCLNEYRQLRQSPLYPIMKLVIKPDKEGIAIMKKKG